MTDGPIHASPGHGAAAGSSRVAWFHCFAGIAGDMALGSLLDAGADTDAVVELLRRLPVGGWDLEIETVQRGGVVSTRAVVDVRGDDDRGRTAEDLVAAVRAASLPGRVERRALATFDVLAAAEARLHDLPPSAVHLHEVGGHDALIEIVGTAAALEVLDVDDVRASPVALGTGTVVSVHGTLPNPAPATLRLLEGIPAYGRPVDTELTTPTGAALLRALASGYGPMPPMAVHASGYGAGARELAHLPNATQVVLGELTPPGTGQGQQLVVLESNLDDATGEQLADTLRSLIDEGAADAWLTPSIMKKGRPGHTVHVLCDLARSELLADVVRRHTGTLGVRATQVTRWAEARDSGEVLVTGERIRMKIAEGRVKPEHDDVAQVASRTGLTTREVASRAEEAWRRR